MADQMTAALVPALYLQADMHMELRKAGLPEQQARLLAQSLLDVVLNSDVATSELKLAYADIGKPEKRFRNHYRHCDMTWSDEWDSMCNDRCPACRAEIEPYRSEDL